MELTKLEQKVLGLFKGGEIVTISNLYELNKFFKFAAMPTIKEMAFSLVRKGALIRLNRGRYLVQKTDESYDPLYMANYVFDGYIALSSALFIYGYDPTRSFVIWGVTSSRKKVRKIGEYTYVSMPMGKFTFGATTYKGYKVSTMAKTIFDCIYNIHYMGDLKPLMDMIHDMDRRQFGDLISYIRRYNNSSFTQRTGFILEGAGAPKDILTIIRSMIGKSVTKLDSKSNVRAKYNPLWKILDNINLARFSK